MVSPCQHPTVPLDCNALPDPSPLQNQIRRRFHDVLLLPSLMTLLYHRIHEQLALRHRAHQSPSLESGQQQARAGNVRKCPGNSFFARFREEGNPCSCSQRSPSITPVRKHVHGEPVEPGNRQNGGNAGKCREMIGNFAFCPVPRRGTPVRVLSLERRTVAQPGTPEVRLPWPDVDSA